MGGCGGELIIQSWAEISVSTVMYTISSSPKRHLKIQKQYWKEGRKD